MPSDLQSALEYIRLDLSVSVVAVTAVVYDYLLTLSREVDYVRCRSWTWVSTMFIFVRYFGLCLILYPFLSGYFSPATTTVSFSVYAWLVTGVNISIIAFRNYAIYSKGIVNYLVAQWIFLLFMAVADLVMILRVYAMWNQSKTILGLLLCIYVPGIIATFVLVGVYINPKSSLSVTIVWALEIPLCHFTYNLALPLWTYMIPNFVLGGVLLTLAITQILKQSFDMYKVAKQRQSNQYMRLLVREGILFFSLRVLYDITGTFFNTTAPFDIAMKYLNVLAQALLCSMTPRFIIGIREMYDRDVHRCGQGIDTGFGVSSLHGAGRNVTVSSIVFADAVPGEDQIVGEASGSEVIQPVLMGDNVDQV